MEATSGHSKACCNIPPAVSKGYKEKGKYIDLDGMKCYTTGPSHAKGAIFIIYDIFGLSPQAVQGADILAHADDENHQYRVFMPDFFLGNPLPPSTFPPDTDEKKKQLADFFAGPAEPGAATKKVPELLKKIAATDEGKGVEKWGSLGMCWGGKIVSLTAQSGTPFSAVAEVHPAMVDPKDAEGITVPMCMLASKDEDAEAVKKFGEKLKETSHIETFEDQIHGWMAGRGDLENDKVKKEYERGYQTLLDFYHKYL